MNFLNNKFSLVFYILIPVLIVGISFGYTTFPICLAVLLLRLLMTNKDTAAFYLFMFGGPIIGFTRMNYPFLPIYGLFSLLIGLVLAKEYISSFFRSSISSIKYMIAVYIIFIISYLYAEPTPFADAKIVSIIKYGSTMLFAFYIYAKSTKISNEHLAQLSLITVLIYITHTILTAKLSVGTLFDYDWYRTQTTLVSKVYGITSGVGYQIVGITVVLGFSFMLSKVENSFVKLFFYFLVCFHLVMFSGARQAILAFLVVVFFRFAYLNNSSGLARIRLLLFASLLVFIISNIIFNVGSEHVDVIDEGGNGRDAVYLEAFRFIYEYPLLGLGLGGFEFHTKFSTHHPHNLILEILCETGFIGFAIITLILFSFFFHYKLNLKTITNSNNYYFPIILALSVRYMISSDLSDSIELFSAVFALSTMNKF